MRNTIIERVTGIHPKESIVLNPDLDPTLLAQKQSILDIVSRTSKIMNMTLKCKLPSYRHRNGNDLNTIEQTCLANSS